MILDYSSLLQASDRQHLMLLYDDEGTRNSAEADCINEALKAGQFCVYASVDVNDAALMAKLASKIQDCGRHVKEGDLLVVNFMPFYESAAKADLAPFDALKGRIEASIRGRVAAGKSGKTLVVADAACNLTRHRQFGECVALESWWQRTYVEWARGNLDITIICAHPSSVLDRAEERSHISGAHSLTIDLREFPTPAARYSTKAYRQTKVRPIRILVAEPEPDIQAVYRAHFRSLPIDIVTVQDGRECLEQALASGGFDIIIIDSHLEDIGGVEVAKKILEEKPDQDIVLTTTHDPDSIRARLKSESPKAMHVLAKPFRFSQLLSLIKPTRLDS